MDMIFFKDLELGLPRYNMGVGSKHRSQQIVEMIEKFQAVIDHEHPDTIVVVGDTNTTLAGAVVAQISDIPLVHIEAGLRSWDRKMPEEVNRVSVDSISSLLLCPTPTACKNLVVEGYYGRMTRDSHPTFLRSGDITKQLIDTYLDSSLLKSNIMDHCGLLPKRFYFITLHRPSNVDDPNVIQEIFDNLANLDEIGIFPVHPRTRKTINEYDIRVPEQIRMIEPVGFFDAMVATHFAKKVITDSGGLQKEAYLIGTPCVTLRDTTEWPETLGGSWNILVGGNLKLLQEYIRKTQDGERKNVGSFESQDPQRSVSTFMVDEIQEMIYRSR